jgi:hypothetical protein
MSQHEITVDIHAHWGDKPPVYRLYINNELLTERTFIWPGNETYIKEHVLVDLEPGKHNIHVDQVGSGGTIIVKDIVLDGKLSSNEFTITE